MSSKADNFFVAVIALRQVKHLILSEFREFVVHDCSLLKINSRIVQPDQRDFEKSIKAKDGPKARKFSRHLDQIGRTRVEEGKD